MDNSEIPDPLTEIDREKWEVITSIPQNQENSIVIKDNYFHHENLQESHSHDNEESPPPPPPTPPELVSFGNSDCRKRVVAETRRYLRMSWEVVKAKIISNFGRLCLCSVLPITVLLLSLFYLKLKICRPTLVHRNNEDRLLFLIQEKDKKISKLLLQIAEMNETLSSRRSVPVFRIK